MGGLVTFVRVDGGRIEALPVPMELVVDGRVGVGVLDAVDMVVLRGLMGKRLGEARFSGAAVTDDLISGRVRLVILSEGLRIDLVLDGIVDMMCLLMVMLCLNWIFNYLLVVL